MKGLLLSILIVVLWGTATAQKQGNVWAFGYGMGLNFNNGSPQVIKTAISAGEGCASVCNASGQLLFYTNGSIIWDRNNNKMPDGNNLTADPIADSLATNSTTQGAVIVPMPDSSNKYYVFSITSSTGDASWPGRLYYCVVNMDLNGGAGAVESNRKSILLESGLTEKMIAVVGDRCNIWLLVHSAQTVAFEAYEITSGGINSNPVISNCGVFPNSNYIAGTMKVSADRKRIVNANLTFGLELCDFNAATGVVSNAVKLSESGNKYGTCFSPDNSKLYVTTTMGIYQYEFNNGSPTTANVYIGGNGIGDIKLGPDNKIYYSNAVSGLLDVINYPNLSGAACQYIPNAIHLLPNTFMGDGLPNTIPLFERDTTHSMQLVAAPCFSNTYTINANDSGWDYHWDNDTSIQTFKVVDNPGTYIVHYHTPPCVYHADTFMVSFSSGTLPALTVNSGCAHNHNGKAWLTVPAWDTVRYKYTWLDSTGSILSTTDTLKNIAAGKYSVRIMTVTCDTTRSFYLSEEIHHVSFSTDSLVCRDDTVLFRNTSDNAFTSFLWYFGDRDTTTLVSPTHSYAQAGTYVIMLTGSGSICTDTAYKTIIVDAPIKDLHLIADKDSVCAGQAVHFSIQTDNTTTQLLWSYGDNSFATTTNGPSIHAYDTSGRMSVVLKYQYRVCPELTLTDTISVYPFPIVDLGADTSICSNQSISLFNHAITNLEANQYLWSTGNISKDITIAHTGTYYLTLTNTYGCSATDTIAIKGNCYVAIPNAFTPNGDGVNDYFFPKQFLSRGLISFHMQVFSRWGELVFETRSIDGRGWDGTTNGVIQPAGVYIYLIEARFMNDTSEKDQGNVTLIR